MKALILRLNRPKVMGQLRHLLNSVGAVAATHGVVTESSWQLGVGLALALLAFAGSLLAPEKKGT